METIDHFLDRFGEIVFEIPEPHIELPVLALLYFNEVIEAEGDILVVGELASIRNAQRLLETLMPDVFLLGCLVGLLAGFLGEPSG